MTYFEQAVQAVERGLLTAVRIAGRPQQPLRLSERMARYEGNLLVYLPGSSELPGR